MVLMERSVHKTAIVVRIPATKQRAAVLVGRVRLAVASTMNAAMVNVLAGSACSVATAKTTHSPVSPGFTGKERDLLFHR